MWNSNISAPIIWNLGRWVNCFGIRRCTILTPPKFSLPLASLKDDSRHLIKLEQGQRLTFEMKISDIWESEPPRGILSVILPRRECDWFMVSNVANSLHYQSQYPNPPLMVSALPLSPLLNNPPLFQPTGALGLTLFVACLTP